MPVKITNINLLITTVDSILDELYEERGYTPHNAINLNSLVQLLHPLNWKMRKKNRGLVWGGVEW